MKTLAIAVLTGCLFAISMFARAQDVYGDPDAPVTGKVLGTVIHTRDAEELRYVILKQLTDRYADNKGIVVTQAEIYTYIEHEQRSMAQYRKQQEARRDELAQKLAGESLSAAERRLLASELDTLNEMLVNLDELENSAAENPVEAKAAKELVASAFIRQWKINQALYQEYGGRIIFQQGGPEPLDAYRRFLEERQAAGDFEILNQDLEAAFWHYYLTDAIHSFYPTGSKEAAEIFRTPWWLEK